MVIRHKIEECPTTELIRGIENLHKGGPDTLEWSTDLKIRL